MEEQIRKKLKEVEKEHNITILWSIESGSREWGFASPDSDYDIRGVYVNNDSKKNLEHFIFQKNNTISGFSEDRLFDWNLFELPMFMRLIQSNNPSCIDWLLSNTCYTGHDMLKIFKDYFLKEISINSFIKHHWRLLSINYTKFFTFGSSKEITDKIVCMNNMNNILEQLMSKYKDDEYYRKIHVELHEHIEFLKHNISPMIGSDEISIKKILYEIRSTLSVIYMQQFDCLPPINTLEIIEKVNIPFDKKIIYDLIDAKKTRKEKENIICPPEILQIILKTHDDVLKNIKKYKEQPIGYEKIIDFINENKLIQL